jgi:ABC-type polysaccharide/polyol phosphate export permease
MESASTLRWIENRPTTSLDILRLRELWEYRELTYFLAMRDIKAQYKQAALGITWAVIQPLAGVALFTVVFHQVAHLNSGYAPYSVFALVGFLVWTYFSATIGSAARSIVANANLVTKVYFPRMAAPISALLPGLMGLAPGLVVLGLLMAVAGVAPTVALFALPLCLIALVLVSLGVGLFLAAVNVKYRDVGGVIGTAVQLWMFASPVVYPSTLVPGDWRWLYDVNPMVGLIDLFRWSLIGGPWPGAELWIGSISAALILTLSVRYFARSERQFADIV